MKTLVVGLTPTNIKSLCPDGKHERQNWGVGNKEWWDNSVIRME